MAKSIVFDTETTGKTYPKAILIQDIRNQEILVDEPFFKVIIIYF